MENSTMIRTRPASFSRRGLSIVEIMIALTMTLIVLGAMMTAFSFASTKMRTGRALMEMAGRVRSTEDKLRSDFANLTVDPRPYTNTTRPPGYIEYIEGPGRDRTSVATIDSYLGDVDDYLGMTVRSSSQLFRGRRSILGGAGTVLESKLAEIIWFTTIEDNDGVAGIDFNADSVRVHRRVLLIRPDLGTLATGINLADLNLLLATNDISCRVVWADAGETVYNVIANNLSDLAVRKNRFCHMIDPYDLTVSNSNYPNVLERDKLDFRRSWDDVADDYSSTDVMLTDVAAFDIRVFSPNASVNIDSEMVIEPGDIGFDATLAAGTPFGAYVDLDHIGTGWFQSVVGVHPLRMNTFNFAAPGESTYDSMTPLYESDGIDTDVDGTIDQGTNGYDDGGTPAPDDNAERETTAPYPYPIRSIRVSIRVIEKLTKQVHQTSVEHGFVPE